MQLWYSMGVDGERIALTEKPFVIGEGREDTTKGAAQQDASSQQQKGFAKQIMPGDYVRARSYISHRTAHSHTQRG